MKILELLFGSLSLVSFILALKVENPLFKISAVLAGILILIVFYVGSVIKEIKEKSEDISLEIKKINERLKIYETLSNHEERIKRIEGSK